jgi:hypothetical protein
MHDKPGQNSNRDYDQSQQYGQCLDGPTLIRQPAKEAMARGAATCNYQDAQCQQHAITDYRAFADRFGMESAEAMTIWRLAPAKTRDHAGEKGDQERRCQDGADLRGSHRQQQRGGQQLEEGQGDADWPRQSLGNAESARRLDRPLEVQQLADRGDGKDGGQD